MNQKPTDFSRPQQGKGKTILIASSISEWGGSEELWSRTIPHLQSAGYHIVVCRPYIESWHPRIVQHASEGVTFFQTHALVNKPLIVRVYTKLLGKIRAVIGIGATVFPEDGIPLDKQMKTVVFKKKAFVKLIEKHNPELVLVSQGGNFDGLIYAQVCMECGAPYTIVSQKAVDFYWPLAVFRKEMRKVLINARQNYFVSHHNKRLTEEQFGTRLTNAQVIFNPIKPTEYIPYPESRGSWKVACIGRLDLMEKGQDMLVRVLSQDKWRNRPLEVMIVGAGRDEVALREMIDLLRVEQVSLHGSVDDIYKVWQQAHALVLPSRTEGLPLVIMEAMMAGRAIITTDAGGNKEFLDEGITGFIGYPSDDSLDETLERAWQSRERWEEMGKLAAKSIRNKVPEPAEQHFAEKLLSICDSRLMAQRSN